MFSSNQYPADYPSGNSPRLKKFRCQTNNAFSNNLKLIGRDSGGFLFSTNFILSGIPFFLTIPYNSFTCWEVPQGMKDRVETSEKGERALPIWRMRTFGTDLGQLRSVPQVCKHQRKEDVVYVLLRRPEPYRKYPSRPCNIG